MNKLFLFILFLSAFAWGDNISVKTELAQLVESAVVEAGVDSVNIPPNRSSASSLEISTVNGVSVCDPEVKEKVKALQEKFIKSSAFRLTYSIYGAYVNDSGKIKYLPPESESIKELIGRCTNLYVSVY